MSSKQDNSKYDFYRRTGATPPSSDSHGTEEELEERRVSFSDHQHKWYQKGGFVECDRGPFIHGVPIPSTNHLLIGTSVNGLPQYRELTLPPKGG